MNGNGKLGRARPWAVLALAVALACGLLCATSALAKKPAPPPPEPPGEWEVIILHPLDSSWSAAYGTWGGQQAGCATVSVGDILEDHAALWSGTAESWVDIHPAGALSSGASGIGDSQVVGEVDSRAGLWTWTGESWECVDLHPLDSTFWTRSGASGASGGQQVGFVERDEVFHHPYEGYVSYPVRVGHASLWSGTPESRVDLHPSGWTVSWTDDAWPSPLGVTASGAYAVSGGQQVGFVDKHYLHFDPYSGESYWDYVCHASLWSGTAESWVDLHPRKSASSSRAYDVSDGQQVGYTGLCDVWRGWYWQHAAMWSGTAKSWVDLHPSGYEGSEAHGVSHGYQAGIAWSSYSGWLPLPRAGVWSGTPESWVDLHDLLPAEYEISEAWDIEVTSTDIWVVGSAYNSTTASNQAVLWHASLPQ